MMPEKFIVTELSRGKTRKQIWNSATPLGLGHPFRWVLERTETGLRLRDLAAKATGPSNARVLAITAEAIESGAPITLEGATSLKVERLRLLRPAYRSNSEEATKGNLPQLFAYSGIRRTLFHAQPVHSAYVAYARGKPVFTFFHTPDGIKLKALLSGVYVKLKGERPFTAKAGEVWQIKKEQLPIATFGRGWHWWRFNFVAATEALKVTRAAADSEESKFLRRAGTAIAAFLLLFSTTVVFWPQGEEKVEEAKPQVIKIYAKGRVSEKVGVQQRKAQETGAVSDPKASAQKTAGEVAPKDPVKHAAAAGAAKQQRERATADAQAKKLREAFSGLSSLAAGSKTGAKKSGGVAKAGSFYDASAVAVGKTEIKAGYSGGNAKVAGIGGGGAAGGAGGKGVGYASGERGSVAGQGGSFVSLDSGGSTVDEGLTKEEVGAVIHKHMNEIRYCHEASLLADPKTEGKFLLGFTINPAGQVISTKVQSTTLPDRKLENCIIRRLVTWPFPKPKGGVTVSVSYPFLFKTLGRQ